ncbi:hypothetical protein [Beijerinckia indica]|uniref:Uncharacterized protein n=1 Tax=Beijerinckia indica subsp. indica (strain ATCC 9039 / DSM 1715 / NCIMB 8712) TaxID=395963 RepID=B2IL41_BEII9|nr:hypothetical protein [Beijerinckia indica]ACB97241.1 hypothetical protein Bind_3689 [Beijerinckia indica subsp. indica ATCC 9039]
MSKFTDLLALATPGLWFVEPGQKLMADDTLLPIDWIKSGDDLGCIGAAHFVGPGVNERQRGYANALLFSASREMALLLEEALTVYDNEFENDLEISGADLLDWFFNWRLRVKRLVNELC